MRAASGGSPPQGHGVARGERMAESGELASFVVPGELGWEDRHDDLASIIDHREAAVLQCDDAPEKCGVALAPAARSRVRDRWRLGIRLGRRRRRRTPRERDCRCSQCHPRCSGAPGDGPHVASLASLDFASESIQTADAASLRAFHGSLVASALTLPKVGRPTERRPVPRLRCDRERGPPLSGERTPPSSGQSQAPRRGGCSVHHRYRDRGSVLGSLPPVSVGIGEADSQYCVSPAHPWWRQLLH